MKLSKLSGATIAAAAAALLLSGAQAPVSAASKGGKVHCLGVNSCKGKGACKTATNECAGQNSCKGKGWVSLSKSACKAKGGKIG